MIRQSTLVFSILVLGSACVAPPGPSPRVSAPEPLVRDDAPAWDGQPTSWEKLVALEDWLVSPEARLNPGYVPEAQLQLAEGRLTLARRERATLPPQVLSVRLSAAESGFRQLLSRRDVDTPQRQRAEKGLSEASALRKLGGGPAVASSGAVTFQRRGAWSATPPRPRDMTPHRGAFTRITVHHSAKPMSELGRRTPGEVADALRRIQKVHMRDRGFGDIGYHFLIDPVGRVWEGRALLWQGAHSGGTGGSNNVGNVGICLLGDFDNERPTPQAISALETLVASLQKNQGIPSTRIYGHADLKATACPGRHLTAWLDRVSPKSARVKSTKKAYRPASQKRAATPKVVQ